MGELHGNNPGPGRRPRAVPSLLVKGNEIPLSEGDTLIGRGGDAKISILGTLVSRRHAQLTCSDGRVTITDLGARNGIFVNGVKLESPALLEDGDTLLIGTTELTFFLGAPDPTAAPVGRVVFDGQGNMVPESEVVEVSTRTALRFEPEDTLDFDRDDVTVQGSRPPKPRASSALVQKAPTETEPPPTPKVGGAAPVSGALPQIQLIARVTPSPSRGRPSAPPRVGPALRQSSQHPPPSPSSTATPTSDALLSALTVIDRMLARGDADAASRALAGHLAKRVATARAGSPLGQKVVDEASFRGLSLLELTGDPSWFDAVVELHSVANLPMCGAVIDRIAPFVGVVPAASQALLVGYQAIVRELLGDVDVEALEACERILALGA